MKIAIFAFLFLILVSSFFIAYEEKKTPNDVSALHKLQDKFLKIDINDKNLDLDKAIREIKEARKLYPLDDKLKMVDIELENKRANQSN